MNYAICWECLYDIITTQNIKGQCRLRSSENVTIEAQSAGNQRQRRNVSSLVGASETTCVAPYSRAFCEWLAGLIDGGGSIQVNKQGHTSFEITIGLEDIQCLYHIQHMLGGSMKMRSSGNAYRYRLNSKEGMVTLIHCINGYIRHTSRLQQLHRVSTHLGIPVHKPVSLSKSSNWFAGFFDARGGIDMIINKRPQVSIKVENKLLQDVQWYRDVFGGSIYFDTSKNGYYYWFVQSREDVLMMQYYFKSCTFRSHKSRRFFLLQDYYRLWDQEAFMPDSIHRKAWQSFMKDWGRLSIR